MIKLRKDNKIVLGLSEMNITRLQKGDPILFNMSALKLPDIDMQIYIQKKNGVDLFFTKGDVAVHPKDMVSVGVGNDVIEKEGFGFMFDVNELNIQGLQDIHFFVFRGKDEESMAVTVNKPEFINGIDTMLKLK